MALNETLQKLRQEKSFSKRKVADDLNIPYTTYDGWDKGRCEPSHDNLKKLAEYFGVTIDYLVLGKDTKAIDVEQPEAPDGHPFVGGYPPPDYCAGEIVRVCEVLSLLPDAELFSSANTAGYVIISAQFAKEGTHFAYRARGNELHDSGIGESDLLIVRRTKSLASGSIAVVRTPEGNGLVCRFFKVSGGIVLMPDNTREPLFFRSESEIDILGRVVESRRLLK